MSYHDGFRDSRRDGSFRGRSGGYGHRGQKRQRPQYDDSQFQKEESEQDQINRMKALLVRIGEISKHSVKKNLERLSRALMKDMPSRCGFMLDTLMQCVLHLTTKTPIYGTLVGLLNKKDNSFGAKVVSRTQEELMNAFKTHSHVKIRMLVRFVGELLNANVIIPSNMVVLLEQILTVADGDEKVSDEDKDLPPRHVRDFLVYVVVGALPWTGKSLQEGSPDALAAIMSKIANYLSARPMPAAYNVSQVFPGTLEQSGDKLDEMWKSVLEISKDGWIVDSIARPYESFSVLKESNQHTFLLTSIPDQRGSLPANLHPVLRLFEPGEEENAIKKTVDRCVISQYLSDILLFFSDDHKDCAKNMLELPIGPFETKPLIIETILTSMFMVPKSNHSLLFYGVVIIDLFKSNKKEMPKVLGQAINSLFHRLDDLDIECRDRFAQWFSFHLSNFGFNWPWSNWSFVTTLPEESPKRIFCCQILKSLINLSYWKRIYNLVPEEYYDILPSDSIPNFQYVSQIKDQQTEDDDDEPMEQEEKKTSKQEEETPLTDLANGLLPLLEARSGVARIQSYLDEDVTETISAEARLELFIPCLLNVGSKSFSHTFNMLDRYKNAIGSMNETPHDQVRIIELVVDFWQNSDSHIVVLLDKLIAYRIISPPTLVDWVFSNDNTKIFWRPRFMQILVCLLNRVVQRVSALNKFLIKARIQQEKLDPDDTAMEDASADLVSKIEEIEPKMEQAREDKNVIFVMVLEKLCRGVQGLVETLGYKHPLSLTMYGRLRQILRVYNNELDDIWDRLEENILSHNIDNNILTLFRSVKQLL